MNEKCFCHLTIGNESYQVKDSVARQGISNLDSKIDDTKTEINNEISEMDGRVSELETPATDKYIFIGDSYGVGYTPDGDVTSWCDILANKLKLGSNDYYKICSKGAGFVATGSGGKTFLQILTDSINTIENKDLVKYIIVGGGYNDANYNSSFEDIRNAIELFTTYCNTNFPNSKIYIACFGYNTNKTNEGGDVRDKLINVVIPAYKSTPNGNNPSIYIENSNLILHSTDLFSSDGFHPNNSGQNVIANKLFTALHGSVNLSFPLSMLNIDMSSKGGYVNEPNGSQILGLGVNISNNIARIWLQENTNIVFNSPGVSISGNVNFELGTYSSKHLSASRNTTLRLPIKCLLVSTSQGNNLKVFLQIKQISNNAWETISNITQISIYAFGDYTFLDFN